MILNGKKTFNKFELCSDAASSSWHNVIVSIDGEMIQPYQRSIVAQNVGEVINIDDAALMPVATKLMSLSEAIQSSFVITVSIDGEQVVRHALPLTLMA
jgi:hypothetical protein